MAKKMKTGVSVGITVLLILGASIGLLDLASEKTKGTNVSGIQYDGNGGPWTLAGSPYVIVDSVTVLEEQTLTIEAGVEVRLDAGYMMYVYGTLRAVGLENKRITITSNKVTPEYIEVWNSIQIMRTGHAEIKYSDIGYGSNGILLRSSNNIITKSYIYSCNQAGISLQHSSNNNISYNSFSYNSRGINIYISSNNTITNNNIWNNLDGLYIDSSSYNIVVNNNIEENANSGIHIWASSSDNWIYHNNLMNNENQALEFATDNHWNDTYPSAGNYWSDYSQTCKDNFDGPATPQNTGSPDGICDTQYDIDTKGIDYFPLKNSAEIAIPEKIPSKSPSDFLADYWWILLIVAAVVAVIVILGIVWRKKKKGEAESQPPESVEPLPPPTPPMGSS